MILKRLLAFGIDLLAVSLIQCLFWWPKEAEPQELAMTYCLQAASDLVVWMLWFGAWDCTLGTPGKRLLGLRQHGSELGIIRKAALLFVLLELPVMATMLALELGPTTWTSLLYEQPLLWVLALLCYPLGWLLAGLASWPWDGTSKLDSVCETMVTRCA